MAQEQVEEYLETIYDLEKRDGQAKTTAIAKCMKISPASVTEVLRNLSEKSLIKYEPYYGATLTERGKNIAETIKRKHRLLEVFLCNVLHIKEEKVHDEACRMEHTISEDTENALCRMMNAPARCPHGSPISPCNLGVGSCAECDVVVGAGIPVPASLRHKKIIPVTELSPGHNGKIAFIRGDKKIVQRLSDLGLTLGTTVTVARKTPLNGPIEICVRSTKLAIDHAIAENIFIENPASVNG